MMPRINFNMFSAAWQKTSGAKRIFWIGIGFYLLIIVPVLVLQITIDSIFIDLLNNLILLLFNAGLLYLGIKRAQNLAIHSQEIFFPLKPGIIVRLIVTALVKYIITLLPIILFIFIIAAFLRIFPGKSNSIIDIAKPIGFFIVITSLIYLQIRMCLSTAFILDRQADFWSAIQLSFQATKNQVLLLFLLFLPLFCLLILSAIPLGIGLIWSIPLACILYGMIYKELAPPIVKSTPQKRVFNA